MKLTIIASSKTTAMATTMKGTFLAFFEEKDNNECVVDMSLLGKLIMFKQKLLYFIYKVFKLGVPPSNKYFIKNHDIIHGSAVAKFICEFEGLTLKNSGDWVKIDPNVKNKKNRRMEFTLGELAAKNLIAKETKPLDDLEESKDSN